MKQLLVGNFHSLRCVVALLASLGVASADPTQPFALPVATRLSNDVAALQAIPDRTHAQRHQLNTLKSGLDTYHRPSTTPSGDIGILRSLNSQLDNDEGYPPLLSDAANAWLAAYESEYDSLTAQLLTSPRGSAKFQASGRLSLLSNQLARAEAATDTTARVKALTTTATRLTSASNAVARAAKAAVGLSSMGARIGALTFFSAPGETTGTFTNETLDIVATQSGTIEKVIALHVTGVSTNPATYFLGTDANFALYTATLVTKHTNYLFQGLSGPETNRSTLTIDAVTTNYVLGRFHFTAERTEQISTQETNRIVSITAGEFQLNR